MPNLADDNSDNPGTTRPDELTICCDCERGMRRVRDVRDLLGLFRRGCDIIDEILADREKEIIDVSFLRLVHQEERQGPNPGSLPPPAAS